MKTLNFKLQGLHCEACIKLATMKLKKIEGVKEIKITLSDGSGEAKVEEAVTIEQLRAALVGSDYSLSN